MEHLQRDVASEALVARTPDHAHALLDLLVEGVPSPAKKGSPIDVDGASAGAFVFKTVADPFAGRINLFRVLKGTVTADTTLVNLRSKGKERMGTLLEVQGKEHHPALDFGEGDIGAVAKLKEAQTGDLLTDKEVAIESPDFGFPEPVMQKVEGSSPFIRLGFPVPRATLVPQT